MGKEIFDQSFFMQCADARRKELGLTTATVCSAAGRADSAWSKWKKREEELAIYQLIAICQTLRIRPQWAFYKNGPIGEDHLPAEEWEEKGKQPARLVALKPKLKDPRDVADIVREEQSAYPKTIQPVPPKSEPRNLRDRLKVFHETTPDDPKAIPTPNWLHIAAGEGTDLERSEEYKYWRELRDWKGVHSAIVRGDSMLNTLHPGDVIVMQEFRNGRMELPQIESEEEKLPLAQFKRETGIEHEDICVVSINDDAPTLKRIMFDTRRSTDWKLQIVADNPPAWGPTFQVALGDKIVFHAKVIGIKGLEDIRKRRGAAQL